MSDEGLPHEVRAKIAEFEARLCLLEEDTRRARNDAEDTGRFWTNRFNFHRRVEPEPATHAPGGYRDAPPKPVRTKPVRPLPLVTRDELREIGHELVAAEVRREHRLYRLVCSIALGVAVGFLVSFVRHFVLAP